LSVISISVLTTNVLVEVYGLSSQDGLANCLDNFKFLNYRNLTAFNFTY